MIRLSSDSDLHKVYAVLLEPEAEGRTVNVQQGGSFGSVASGPSEGFRELLLLGFGHGTEQEVVVRTPLPEHAPEEGCRFSDRMALTPRNNALSQPEQPGEA